MQESQTHAPQTQIADISETAQAAKKDLTKYALTKERRYQQLLARLRRNELLKERNEHD